MKDSSDQKPPPISGSFEDAEKLRRWAFLQLTPAQRLAWLVEALEIAYRTGALKPRIPAETEANGSEPQ